MKKCMHKIENMPLQPSPIYSCPWQMSQSVFLPVNLLCSYILIGNCVRGQKLANGPGVGKCPAPGQCNICKFPTPGTDKAGKCPQVARGGGLGPAGIDWCIILLSMVHPSPASPGICHTTYLYALGRKGGSWGGVNVFPQFIAIVSLTRWQSFPSHVVFLRCFCVTFLPG